MNRFLAIGALALLGLCSVPATATPVSARVQDEKADEAKTLKDIDDFVAFIKKTRKDLADLQLRYNGSDNSDQKQKIEAEFTQTRDAGVKRAKEVWAEVEAFVAKYPKNVAVRRRRLEELAFDNVSNDMRAKDADVLFELTGDGQFVHKAAKSYEKAYEYVNAAARWKTAAERADTYQVEMDLANACMNAMDFASAKKAYLKAAELANGQSQKNKQDAERQAELAGKYVEYWTIETELRKKAEEKKDLPIAEIMTERGKIVIELFEDQAPNTVANFIELAEKKFYDNTTFHRNIAYFMIQGGDPQGNGMGGPGYTVKDECNRPDARMFYPGVLAMANVNRPDTNGSQFFITSSTTAMLNGRHTVFGRVLEGAEIARVTPIDPGDPQNKAAPFRVLSVKISNKRNHPYVAEKIAGNAAGGQPTPPTKR